MAPQKSKEHTRPTNVAALPSATRTFFSAIAAPLFIAFAVAFVGSIIAGWRNDLLFDEKLGVTDERVAELDEKYKAMLHGLTELRILVATKMASDKAP